MTPPVSTPESHILGSTRLWVICILFAFVFPLPAWGQTSVSGQVQDSEGKGIPFVNVLLLQAKDSSLVKGMVSSEGGVFQLDQVQGGTYLVAASMVGYEKRYLAPFTIGVGQNRLDLPPLVLPQAANQLGEVSVVATKPLFEQQIDRLVVNVQSSITAAGSTALDVLERSPGITVDRQNGGLVMNGKQGVMVMVNGRLNRLPLSAVVQMLAGMNASNVDKIELITTPPAQYDAEGNAGMINIVLKDNAAYGTNGSYSFFAGHGFFEKAGANFNVNYRTPKFNLFADASLLWDHFWFQIKNDRLVTHENQLTQTSTVSNRPSYRWVYNTRLGFDYKLTAKTTIGGLLVGFDNKWKQLARNTTNILKDDQLATAILIQDREKNNWAHGMGNLNIRHAFTRDHHISLDLDYLRYYHYNPHWYTNTYQHLEENSQPVDKINSSIKVPIQMWVAKADYAMPFGKASKLEAGLKGTISRLKNDVSLEWLQGGTWQTDVEFTQHYRMLEDIGAAYVTFHHPINVKTKLQTGLRYEYTHTHLSSLDQPGLVKRRYGNLFPSVFVSREMGKESNLQLSFSRRISRPTYSDLASVFTYFDPYTLLIGNSSLRPAYTNSFQAVYQFRKSYLLTLGYSKDTDAINWLVRIDPISNTQITYKGNLTSLNTLSLGVSLPVRVSSWWQMQNHLAAGWQRSIVDYQGETIHNSRRYGQVNTVHTFRLPADFSVEVSGIYHTRTLFGMATQKPLGTLNVGIEKKLKKEKGKLQIAVSDLLWTNRLDYHYFNPTVNLDQSIGVNFEPRVVRLTYSHNFGNKNVEAATKRATSSEEERSRVGNQ